MPKPTPEEVLKGIEDSEADDELEKVLAMTPEQREKELAQAGYDLAKVNAGADAMYERMQKAAVKSRAKELEAEGRKKSLRPERRQRPVVLWIAAAATVAVLGGAVYATVTKAPEGPVAPAPRPPVPSTVPTEEAPVDLIAAGELRRKAFAACSAKEWYECLAKLDEAKKVDPAGDTSPEVVTAREQAARGIQKGPK